MDTLSSLTLSPRFKRIISSPQIKLHLAAVSDDYLVLVSVVDEEVRLSLWDVAYFTNQAGSSLSSNPLQVCCAGGRVVVCGSEAVMVINLEMGHTTGTLAAALGRGQGLTETDTQVQVSD